MMVFNPLFFNAPGTNEELRSLKASKSNLNNYLFADIIKVYNSELLPNTQTLSLSKTYTENLLALGSLNGKTIFSNNSSETLSPNLIPELVENSNVQNSILSNLAGLTNITNTSNISSNSIKEVDSTTLLSILASTIPALAKLFNSISAIEQPKVDLTKSENGLSFKGEISKNSIGELLRNLLKNITPENLGDDATSQSLNGKIKEIFKAIESGKSISINVKNQNGLVQLNFNPNKNNLSNKQINENEEDFNSDLVVTGKVVNQIINKVSYISKIEAQNSNLIFNPNTDSLRAAQVSDAEKFNLDDTEKNNIEKASASFPEPTIIKIEVGNATLEHNSIDDSQIYYPAQDFEKVGYEQFDILANTTGKQDSTFQNKLLVPGLQETNTSADLLKIQDGGIILNIEIKNSPSNNSIELLQDMTTKNATPDAITEMIQQNNVQSQQKADVPDSNIIKGNTSFLVSKENLPLESVSENEVIPEANKFVQSTIQPKVLEADGSLKEIKFFKTGTTNQTEISNPQEIISDKPTTNIIDKSQPGLNASAELETEKVLVDSNNSPIIKQTVNPGKDETLKEIKFFNPETINQIEKSNEPEVVSEKQTTNIIGKSQSDLATKPAGINVEKELVDSKNLKLNKLQTEEPVKEGSVKEIKVFKLTTNQVEKSNEPEAIAEKQSTNIIGKSQTSSSSASEVIKSGVTIKGSDEEKIKTSIKPTTKILEPGGYDTEIKVKKEYVTTSRTSVETITPKTNADGSALTNKAANVPANEVPKLNVDDKNSQSPAKEISNLEKPIGLQEAQKKSLNQQSFGKTISVPKESENVTNQNKIKIVVNDEQSVNENKTSQPSQKIVCELTADKKSGSAQQLQSALQADIKETEANKIKTTTTQGNIKTKDKNIEVVQNQDKVTKESESDKSNPEKVKVKKDFAAQAQIKSGKPATEEYKTNIKESVPVESDLKKNVVVKGESIVAKESNQVVSKVKNPEKIDQKKTESSLKETVTINELPESEFVNEETSNNPDDLHIKTKKISNLKLINQSSENISIEKISVKEGIVKSVPVSNEKDDTLKISKEKVKEVEAKEIESKGSLKNDKPPVVKNEVNADKIIPLTMQVEKESNPKNLAKVETIKTNAAESDSPLKGSLNTQNNSDENQSNSSQSGKKQNHESIANTKEISGLTKTAGMDATGGFDSNKTVKYENILKEVSRFIIKHEKNSITFNVEPENLGKLKITLDIMENNAKVHVEVENEAVKKLIENNVTQLFQSLNQSGLSLSFLQVSTSEQKQMKQGNPSKKKFDLEKELLTDVDEIFMTKNLGYNTYEFLA
ncbi:MAG: flagellar hook-length control protein FliK [Ignavibacteriales bacterium]|nr:flagellar hook-length control protein FliK [Ignavibacteriales bacterium]